MLTKQGIKPVTPVSPVPSSQGSARGQCLRTAAPLGTMLGSRCSLDICPVSLHSTGIVDQLYGKDCFVSTVLISVSPVCGVSGLPRAAGVAVGS